MADHPAARGLRDDTALLDGWVITHDTIVEGVHYLPNDPPGTVGWKLAAVNASDLAAKGAAPEAVLLSLTLQGDGAWERAFLDGLEEALPEFGLSLIGGDTTALPAGAPRVLGMTAMGRAGDVTPSRSDGEVGDALWLVGCVGNAAAGLKQPRADPAAKGHLVDTYRMPWPLLAMGRKLAPAAHAMMDVSDGLLLDAARMGASSGCGVVIDLDALPLSEAFVTECGDDLAARMFAATGGDDYALLVSLPADSDPLGLSLPVGPRVTRVGTLVEGAGISLQFKGQQVPAPETLGYEHRGT
jgi:thiamine-monophosphate kinase